MNSFGAPSISASMAMSDDYNNSVNASRFVKGFGIAALVYSVLIFLGINLLSSGIGIGVGLFIYRYDEGRFYQILGATVIILAFIAPLPFLSPGILASGVVYKGAQILGVLKRSPREDPDWRETNKRTLIGLIAASISLLITLAFMILFVLALVFLLTGRIH